MKQATLIILLAVLFNYGFGQGIRSLPQKDSAMVKGETYAIVVGISSYPYIKPLQYADKDAELFRDFLLSKAGGLVKPENIMVLTNQDATSGNFQTAFQKLYNSRDIKAGDRVYIYFAGHGDGIQDLNEYYLLLYDCQPAGDANNYAASLTAIDMYHLKNRIGKLTKAGVEVVLILDACRTNELPGGYSSQVFSGNVTESKVGEIMMLATGPGEVSIESPAIGNGHGLFTYELIDGLSGRADTEDGGDNNGQVSLAEIQDWVRKNVRNVAQKQFHTKQNPFFCCSEKENIEIARIDSSFLHDWLLVKDDYSKYLNEVASRAVRGQRSNTGSFNADETRLFNSFNNAVKVYNLWGSNSADAYYDSLAQKYPSSVVTENARYLLAGELINFTQKKINLYLNGKDNGHALEMLQKQVSAPGTPGFVKENFYKDSVLTVAGFFTAAQMMQKAIGLIAAGDTALIAEAQPKINFLYARSFYDGDNASGLTLQQALQFAYKAYYADSNAAYISHVLSLLYQKNGQYDSALHYEKRAVALAPKWAYAYNHLGYVYNKTGNTDSAWAYYKKALLADTTYLDAYLNLSLIASSKDAAQKHNKYYTQYFSLPALPAATLVMYGNVLFNMQEYDAAIWFFRQVIQRSPGNADAYFNIANSYAKQTGRFNEAQASYEKAISLNPRFSEAYLNFGYLYHVAGNKAASKQYYEKALQYNAHNAVASFNIANIYLGDKQYDSALVYYKKTTAADAAYAGAWLNAGNVLLYLKKPAEALTYYAMAIAADRNYINAYINSGRCYEELNMPDSAVYFYNKAIEMQPLTAIPHAALHETLPAEVISQPKNNLDAYNNLAYLYLNAGKNDSAVAYFTKAVALKPAAIYYAALGECFLNLKEEGSALANYLKSVDLDKTDTGSYYNIACIYCRRKDAGNTLRYLELAFKAGFADRNQVMTDEDLAYIRNTGAFRQLIAKYFKK